MLKTSQVKAGDESNIENSTDHLCEDTRQNALAALADLGHVTILTVWTSHYLMIQRAGISQC